MSVSRFAIEQALSEKLPQDVVTSLLNEYQHIKQQFFLKKFQPSELNAARFVECVLRIIEFLDTGSYTPLGKQLKSEKIINCISNNTNLPEAIRFLVPQITKVLLCVRNKRDVAHVGGEVNPNYSDSLFLSHSADWILIELIRNYHTNSINEARKIVESINETKIPVIAEMEGYIKVQNTSLSAERKTLLILYHKQPDKISDLDLAKWIKYTNISRYRKQILKSLDDDALIYYHNGFCTLIPKGIAFVEKNISFDLVV